MTGTERYIYLLKRKPTAPPYYDQTAGLVLVASTATRARKMAYSETFDEGPSAAAVWLHSKLTSCQRVGVTHRAEGVLLKDYKAG